MSPEYFLIISILIIPIAGTKPKLLFNFERLNTNLIECIVKIIKSRTETTFKLAIQNSQEFTFLASELIKNIFAPAIINAEEHHRRQGIDT